LKSQKFLSVIAALCLIVGILSLGVAPVVISNHTRESYNVNTAHLISHDILTALSDIESDTATATKIIASDTLVKQLLHEEPDIEENKLLVTMCEYLTSIKGSINANNVFIISTGSNKCYTYSGISKVIDPEGEDAWVYDFINSQYAQTTYYQNDGSGMIITVVTCIYDKENNVIGICGVESTTATFETLFASYKEKYGVDATFMSAEQLKSLKKLSVNMTDDYIKDILTNKEDGSVFTDETGIYVIATYCPSYNLYFTLHGESTDNAGIQRMILHDAIAVIEIWVGMALIIVLDKKKKKFPSQL